MNSPETSRSIAHSAGRFFSGTLISRFSGFFREVAMAAFFGASPGVGAFWMAFRFAHLLRRLFGEGGLNVAFIPHFEALRQEDPKKGAQFFFGLSTFLTAFLLILTGVAECILGYFLWKENLPQNTLDVIRMTMLLLPATSFICLYALNSAFLSCERVFFLPSAAPTLLNGIWIGALFFLSRFQESKALDFLAMILVAAFAAQWFFTLPLTYRMAHKGLPKGWWKEKTYSNKEMFSLLKPFSLALIGVGATQINSFLDALFARAAEPEGPAFLWYAIRLQQLPLALFGVALAAALLPSLSRAIQKGELHNAAHLLSATAQRTFSLMVVCTIAIFALGGAGVDLVYHHGAFTETAVKNTTYALFAYGIALVPMSWVLIFATPYYALKNYLTPALASCTAVIANLGFNALFVFAFHWGSISVALATGIASSVNAAFLWWKLPLALKTGRLRYFRLSLATLLALAVTHFLSSYFPSTPHLAQQIFHFSAEAATFFTTLTACAYFFKIREILDLPSLIHR